MICTSHRSALRQGVRAVVLPLLLICSAGADPKPTGRSAKDIEADITAVRADIEKSANFDAIIAYDPRFRQQMGSEIGSRRKKEADLLRELAAAAPKSSVIFEHLAAVDDARCAFWGDAEAAARIEARASDNDKTVAVDGKGEQQLIAWWSAIGDADAQTKAVDEMAALAKANPTDDSLADSIHLMILTNPASVAIGQRLTDLVCVTMAKTPVGKSYAAVPNRIDEPLDFDGSTLKGTSFQLKKLRGKVVMVDFWATWCPPCRAEIPHVAELYTQYHDQGFEIIGVSSDNDRVELAGFLKDHSEMPWQELFSAGNGWHPLTKKFGINSIPTMYLVDRNGNLRMMSGGSANLKAMIPTLLAETYVAPPTAPAKPGAKPIGKPIGSIGG